MMMANPYSKDPHDLILDSCHNAVASQAVFPEASKTGAPLCMQLAIGFYTMAQRRTSER